MSKAAVTILMMKRLKTYVALLTLLPALTLVAEASNNAEAPLELGDWYHIGPFKDAHLGMHLDSFAHVFDVEKAALVSASALPDLNASWAAGPFLGEENPTRRWKKHEAFADGYLNYLPHGPAPMKNESHYLFRTITAPRDMSVDVRIYALDNIHLWINGRDAGFVHQRGGSSRFMASFVKKVQLSAGVNRLLIKITSMHGLPQFSFAMPPYTPSNGVLSHEHDFSNPNSDDRKKVEAFRTEVTPIPMYDPQELKMAAELDNAAATPAGAAYVRRLAALKGKLKAAVEQQDYAAGGRAIDTFWNDEKKNLPPIAFFKSRPFGVNAIAPTSARGHKPATICIIDPSRPEQGERVIFHDPTMAIFDMNVSYDAKTLFFSARVDHDWNIYEVGTDGTGLKQITKDAGSNISPVLLPNDEIMFVSSRDKIRVVCQNQPSGVLFVCNRDGSNVRRVSGNTLSDHTPQVMNDGRVIFTRWDYGVGKNVFCRQNLWTINPDGTGFRLFGSNVKEDPNAFWQARPIPGRPEVVSVFGAHHQEHAGMIGLVWNEAVGRARDRRGEGFRWITREMPYVADKGIRWAYRNPFPLLEHQFIVSYGGDGGEQNRLYLLDDRGNRSMICEDKGGLGCFCPLPLRTRKRPPIIPTACTNKTWSYRDPVEAKRNPDETLWGTLLLQDVYEGIGRHIKRGEVKALQVMEQVPKWLYISPDHQGYGPTIGRGTMYIRRVMGSVPVEEDGSAHFKVPAIRDISFDALDSEGRVIRCMGSPLHVMPGERQSCVGCHENRGMPPPMNTKRSLAAGRQPSIPEYPAWSEKGIIDYNQTVQPALDKHCVQCHSGAQPKGAIDLSGDKTRFFNISYDSLLDHGLVDYINMAGTGHEEGTAKDRGAIISKIRGKIETDHSGKVLPLEDRQRIYNWIDAGVPYYSTHNVTRATNVGGRDRLGGGFWETEIGGVFNRRCNACHLRKVSARTYNYTGGERWVTSKLWNANALSQFGFGRYGTAKFGPDHRMNLTHPEWSQLITAPLSRKAGGLQLCKGEVFKDKNDPDYQALLGALRKAGEQLYDLPRVDMQATTQAGGRGGDKTGTM